MNLPLPVPAVERLIDVVADGVGSVAGPVLAPWAARRAAQAREITAKSEASALLIQAKAQKKARRLLRPSARSISGTLDISDRVRQRIQYQEKKRQANIESVVANAATRLEKTMAPDTEPDPDWTARFFNHVKDVSSTEMQRLWAKVLSGEVERPGTISLRTLDILRNLDKNTATAFERLCSLCVFLSPTESHTLDARVPSLGGHPGQNSLREYNLAFNVLNRLNEHGLIISDYNSWFNYQMSIGLTLKGRQIRVPFRFQNRHWILVPHEGRKPQQEYRLSGVALSVSGRELASAVETKPDEAFVAAFRTFALKDKLDMRPVLSP